MGGCPVNSLEHNADRVALRLQTAGNKIRTELQRTLPVLAQRAAAVMRREAPKGSRSTLANSVQVRAEGADGLSVMVEPTVDYAKWVHGGRKPGKGLPRFFDPASASIVAWLQDRMGDAARLANPKWRRARVGSGRRTRDELELRDRYMALSRAVKARGIKADPFVTRTADAVRQSTLDGLVQAVVTGVRKAGLGAGR
jgi:hypothetical protein